MRHRVVIVSDKNAERLAMYCLRRPAAISTRFDAQADARTWGVLRQIPHRLS